MARLTGQIALITGGGTGIGRACALLFAREGARVAVAGRRMDPLEAVAAEISAVGGEALAVCCDVTKATEVEQLVRSIVARFGTLTVLVNNAGVLLAKTAEETSEAEWDHLMAVNLKGTFLVSRGAAGAAQGRRLDRQRRLSAGSGGDEKARGLRGIQGRRRAAYQGHGARPRARGHPRQLYLPIDH